MSLSGQQSIRVPQPRWRAAIQRARTVHTSSGAGVINAFLVKYNRGELDAEVAAWLTETTGVKHEAAPAPAGTAS